MRRHFQQIFRKLFCGAKADIVLEDAEDILEAGIEVIARPLLREFQEDSQFIVITHVKRTMGVADEPVGMTMQTQGVSKKISVRFDQYGEEEETAAVA